MRSVMHVSSHLGLIQGGYLIVYVSGPWADPLANPPGTCFTKRLREDRLALPLPPGVKFCSPFVMPLSSTMLRYDCSSPAQQPLGEKSDFSLGWHGLDILHLANPPGVKADPLADPLSHCQGVRPVSGSAGGSAHSLPRSQASSGSASGSANGLEGRQCLGGSAGESARCLQQQTSIQATISREGNIFYTNPLGGQGIHTRGWHHPNFSHVQADMHEIQGGVPPYPTGDR